MDKPAKPQDPPAHLPPFVENFRARQKRYGQLWLDETDRFEPEEETWDLADCAELADELQHHALAAQADPDFDDEWTDWGTFIFEKSLWLPLEQSCHEGVLLPFELRAVRLASCPESMMNPLRIFFGDCPAHVQSHVALYYHTLVRLDRAQRTGKPDWRPETAVPAPQEPAFFRPPVLTARNYGR